METLKLIAVIVAAAFVGTFAIIITIVLIKARINTVVRDAYEVEDDLDEYEAALSGLPVEKIKEQNRNIKRGVKKGE